MAPIATDLSPATRREIAEKYRGGRTSSSLIKEYNIRYSRVMEILKDAGISSRSISEARRSCSLNENAFTGTTEQSMYWAGFLMADGCICFRRGENSPPQISVTLQRKDFDHLLKLAKFLNWGGKIYEYSNRPAAQLQFTSARIANSLIQNFGLSEKKTFNAKATPTAASNRHFWRGVIDGDGTVGMVNEGKYPRFSLCGAEPLMEQFRDFCAPFVGDFRPPLRLHTNVYVIQYAAANAVTLARMFYKGSRVALDRKKQSALSLTSCTRALWSSGGGSPRSLPPSEKC